MNDICNEKVDIILATYNGAEYIEQQLQSILEQTYANWSLIITDDCSTDETIKKISNFVLLNNVESKVEIISHDASKFERGPVGNFMNGLSRSKNSLIMFCDQDDVWLPNKISSQVNKIHGLNMNFPCVSFCDSKVVDKNLNDIGLSFRQSEKLNIDGDLSFEKLAFQNYAPGCCMIINDKLRDIALSDEVKKNNIVMHDWYFMLIASLYGFINHSDDVLMLYRQHENNQVGVSSKTTFLNLFKKLQNSYINHKRAKLQLKELSKLPSQKDSLLKLVGSFEFNKIKKIRYLIKNNLCKSNFIKTIVLYMMI